MKIVVSYLLYSYTVQYYVIDQINEVGREECRWVPFRFDKDHR